MPKLDYDKLTTEQARLIRKVRQGLADTEHGIALKELILSIDPELTLAEKHEIGNLAIGDVDDNVHHSADSYATEDPSEIPPILAQLTSIVVHAHALNGDLGYLSDVMKSPEMYLGTYTEKTNEDKFKPLTETKHVLAYDHGPDSVRHAGPFDTEDDAMSWATDKGCAPNSFRAFPLQSVVCDEEGNWI